MAVNSSFSVGDVVVIERKRRPWRLTTVQSIQGDLLQVNGGHLYSASTGWRLDATHGKSERVTPLTPARMDYLQLVQFQKAVIGLDITRVPPERIARLAELAKAFSEALQTDFTPNDTDTA
ncbi:hypothetical protein [Deinococcus peraridilitoris]|uniref:Uncharacterized protein n=1 Tax=Deinococcus peraridilitoris (strain DSM 19664 / LMG 22246 / CIP 109416 / KR-200) TaxID=937777 RepID=K9ZY64_DEIPD|nr:hypothetical protein [Deinococcus peraridilitoris]AFZ66546.1 hypothetical protein Deipe_0982 [Deinococcus peraridilitoris DSM 19664]